MAGWRCLMITAAVINHPPQRMQHPARACWLPQARAGAWTAAHSHHFLIFEKMPALDPAMPLTPLPGE
jgi:hypothetical protein